MHDGGMTQPTQHVYKILRADEWARFQQDGHFDGAPIDHHDGYIHLSTRDQVTETLRVHFADAPDAMIIALDTARLGGRLVREPSRGGALFPHLYNAPLTTAAIVSVTPARDWQGT